MSEVRLSQGANILILLNAIVVMNIITTSTIWAAGKKLTYNFGAERTESALELTNGVVNNNVTKNIHELRFSEDDKWGILSYNVGFRLENPDYSSVVIIDSSGEEELLSNLRNEHDEYFVDTTMVLAKGSHSLSFGGATSVGNVAFRNHSLNIGYQESFFNKTTILGVSTSWSKDWRRSTHFTDGITFIERPTKVETNTHSFTYDQILSERLKGSFQYSYQDENVERPSSHKIVTRFGYVVTDQIFARLSYSYANEDDDDPITTD